MRAYSSIYVDAGYLLSAAATRVTGSSYRNGVAVQHAGLIDALITQVVADSGLPLLRLHWYDSAGGANGAADATQQDIALLRHVKVRLGRRSPFGEQKGVDLRIGLDLVNHARTRNAEVMYLVSGDDDLTEAVEEAQALGVQVVLMPVPARNGKPHAVARHLERAVDDLLLIADTAVTDHVSQTIRSAGPPRPTPVSAAAKPGPPTNAAHPPLASPPAPVPSAPVPGPPPPRPGPVPRPPAVPAASGPAPSPAESGGSSQMYFTTSTKDGPAEGSYRGEVYAARTGDAPTSESTIVEVARTVVENWIRQADAAARQQLVAQRPTVPGELDRALLIDLSDRVGVYDLAEHDRHRIRDAFWQQVDQHR